MSNLTLNKHWNTLKNMNVEDGNTVLFHLLGVIEAADRKQMSKQYLFEAVGHRAEQLTKARTLKQSI